VRCRRLKVHTPNCVSEKNRLSGGNEPFNNTVATTVSAGLKIAVNCLPVRCKK